MAEFLIGGKRAAAILSEVWANSERAVMVLGAGIVGKELISLFLRAGFRVILLDEKPLVRDTIVSHTLLYSDNFVPGNESAIGQESFVVIDSWVASSEQLQRLTESRPVLGVFSPGILPASQFIQGLKETLIPLVSEMDLALHYLGMPEISVTGTNGKTTTVTLAHQIMQHAGFQAELLGNVGTAFSSQIAIESLKTGLAQPHHFIVAELSSYQLDSSQDFHPHVAVCLNVTDDHLEKHGSMSQYLEAKSRIFAKQSKDDWSIYFCDDPLCLQTITKSNARLLPIGFAHQVGFAQGKLPERSLNQDHALLSGSEIELFLDGSKYCFSLQGAKLFGRHNLVNAAAAVISTFLCGVPKSIIDQVLKTFVPLPHRLEPVVEHEGVLWINDSKSTNVASVEAALIALLESYPERNLVLLCGGISKGGPWRSLQSYFGDRVRAVLLFGRDRWSIAEEMVYETITRDGFQAPKEALNWEAVTTLEDAVIRAQQIARRGDIVVLTPGGASFDEFKNFEHRGNKFRDYIYEHLQIA